MPQFSDAVFNVRDLDEAKRIILTSEGGLNSDVRWTTETPYLRDQMLALFAPDDLLLDFGCGIGRLAKAWLDACPAGRVLGVDSSLRMRQLAPAYVSSDRFAACGSSFLERLIRQGLRFDGVVACWIIQHVFDPAAEIERLHAALRPRGRLLVVNNMRRAVPTNEGWVDDGFDVARALAGRFHVESLGKLPENATSPLISQHTFIGVYQRVAN